MNNELNSIIQNSDNGLKQEFLEKNVSKLKVKSDYKKTEFDYSWLDKIEETITYLDEIVRNPRRFIVQEEEIVPVEKAKKITLESIKHLATHTNLIQDYDYELGTITPSKVLNINKEESFDIYENRFIYSLIINLQMFIARRKEITKEGSSCKINKKFNYSASTKIGNENINVSLDLDTSYFEDLVGKDTNGLGLSERLDRIELIVGDFSKTQSMKELAAAHVLMVKSPIRKTNVILKNTNFQKALELWEFIEQYNVNDKLEVNDSKDYEDEGTLKENMDNSFLLDYLILNNNNNKSNKIKKYYITKIVKDFIENNDDYTEAEFKKLITNEFNSIYKLKKKREEIIESIFKKNFIKFKENHKKALGMLKWRINLKYSLMDLNYL